jgi:hypothetical protein
VADPGALERVRERIGDAAARAGRNPSAVTLVAVSKGAPAERVLEAARAGQRDFGENRAPEAVAKIEQLEAWGIGGLRWHFVGRLQRNKVRTIFGTARAAGGDLVCLVHSVDRLELASEIGKRAAATADVLVEVNTSGEEAKGGVHPSELAALVDAILGVPGVPGVRVTGLMTMAPRLRRPEDARPYFRRLATLRDDLGRRFPGAGIDHLSMGMSQDYEIAVEEGATIVRVGAAIFGPGSGRGDRAGAQAPASLR